MPAISKSLNADIKNDVMLYYVCVIRKRCLGYSRTQTHRPSVFPEQACPHAQASISIGMLIIQLSVKSDVFCTWAMSSSLHWTISLVNKQSFNVVDDRSINEGQQSTPEL